MSDCFLCQPEPHWTWAECDHFVAVLGLGPIGSGYTLIAAREHVPSMMDLDAALAEELDWFTAEVQEALGRLWGPSAVCEHGRVAACVAPGLRAHEPHCLHAHRLVFPGQIRVDFRRVAPGMDVAVFDSYLEARRRLHWPGQYLYAQTAHGGCEIGLVQGPLPRQFLRAVAAAQIGRRDLADWRSAPRPDQLNDARALLGRSRLTLTRRGATRLQATARS